MKGKIQIDIVRDPAVIQSYLRRVEEKKLESYMLQAEVLQPTGNPEEDELKKAAYVWISLIERIIETDPTCPGRLRQKIDMYKKNQVRRIARKKYTAQREGIFDEDSADSGVCFTELKS